MSEEKLRRLLSRARERMAYNFDRFACAACSHGVSKDECGCGFKRTGEMIDEIDAVLAETVVDDVLEENTKLRGLLAVADIPCIYCKLPKANIKLCPRGFPGCGRMDDLIEGGHV